MNDVAVTSTLWWHRGIAWAGSAATRCCTYHDCSFSGPETYSHTLLSYQLLVLDSPYCRCRCCCCCWNNVCSYDRSCVEFSGCWPSRRERSGTPFRSACYTGSPTPSSSAAFCCCPWPTARCAARLAMGRKYNHKSDYNKGHLRRRYCFYGCPANVTRQTDSQTRVPCFHAFVASICFYSVLASIFSLLPRPEI